MTCPKCKTDDVSLVGDSHYVCNNPKCMNGNTRTQFQFIEDTKVVFPYNQIFVNRKKSEFYRKPYLKLSSAGVTTLTK